MHKGQMVLAKLNGGKLVSAEVIEIHGDIARIAGAEEMRIVRDCGREPLGIGFPIHTLILEEKAKSD